ncbi:MAG: hypothetical protein ACREA0_03135 [bacterium]
MKTTASHVALLAPVPLVHLTDGADIAKREGRVAFGSRAWDVFRELDGLRRGLTVDAYLYASHIDGPLVLAATWHARYIGHVESVNGAHPGGMRYRPPSTARYPSDNQGHWAVFWEVEALRQVAAAEYRPLRDFTGFGKRRPYGRNFVPEGPLLVEHP